MPDNSELISRLKAAKKPNATVTSSSLIQLDSIKDRASDTRELNDEHVQNLMESIRVVGLIEPLVTDKDYVLLAGGHRKAAIALLRTTDRTSFDEHFSSGVPVHVMDFSAIEEPDRALEIEITENEQRRDYTPKEVRALATRLLKTGRFHGSKGRPPQGKESLMSGLLPIVGKSRRTIQAYLEKPKEENAQNCAINPDIYLDQAIAKIKKWEKATGNDGTKLIRSIKKRKSD